MPTASAVIEIPVSAETVWHLVGGFNSLPDWLPFIAKSEPGEGGRVRHLTTAAGVNTPDHVTFADDSVSASTCNVAR